MHRSSHGAGIGERSNSPAGTGGQFGRLVLAGILIAGAASAQGFRQAQLIAGQTTRPSEVIAVDLDGDGDLDALSAAANDRQISWHENFDGAGEFIPGRHIVATELELIVAIFADDLDGDGDQDVLSVWQEFGYPNPGTVSWYENLDGAGNFGPRRIVSTDLLHPEAVLAADVDGDGDSDILSASRYDKKIAWYENLDGAGNFGAQQIVGIGSTAPSSIVAEDLDGDGDQDVAAGLWNSIGWYENSNALGSFGPEQTAAMPAGEVGSLAAEDLDGDGDCDLAYTSYYHSTGSWIGWTKNTDGLGSFGGGLTIDSPLHEPVSVAAADVDGDGDRDVFAALRQGNAVVWYENLDGSGGFGGRNDVIVGVSRPVSISLANLDGDGDCDVLWSDYDDHEVNWCENLDGLGTFGPERGITSEAGSATFAATGDLDGDGDRDVVASSAGGAIVWHENLDGSGGFGSPRPVAQSIGRLGGLRIADLDGDGDRDVVWAQRYGDEVAWSPNTDGAGTFGAPRIISTATTDAWEIVTVDLDGDGDLDVLTASNAANEVAWHENLDGAGNFGPERPVSTVDGSSTAICAVDLDGDGDLDVVAAKEPSSTLKNIVAHENLDGLGNFGPQNVIFSSSAGASSLAAEDLDGDGDQDVIIASGNLVRTLTNTGGVPMFQVSQTITHPLSVRVACVALEDLDGDGDPDILETTSWKIYWHENVTGDGTFGAPVKIAPEGDFSFGLATDLDGDGDADPLFCGEYSDEIIWYENGPFPASACQWYCGGGMSLDVYTVSSPYRLGGTFQGSVTISPPNLGAVLVGYLGRMTFPLFGQEGLVNPATAEVMGVPSSFVGNPVVISWAVPLDPLYAGYRVYTQAAGIGGGVIRLTCAYDCEVGY